MSSLWPSRSLFSQPAPLIAVITEVANGPIRRPVMSQCPICNAAIWIGQRYCSTCDSYLPNPEEEDHFCPQCGIRVSPQQELCHKCNASLPGMAGAPFPTMTRARRLPPWVRGIFIGTGLVIGPCSWYSSSKKFRTCSAGGDAAASGPCKANSCCPPIPTAETAPSAPAAQELSGPSAPVRDR